MNYQAIKAANRTINNQECLAGARRLKSKPLFFWFDLKDRKSTRLNSSHSQISYAVFCLKKKNNRPASIPHTSKNLHSRTAMTTFIIRVRHVPSFTADLLDVRSVVNIRTASHAYTQ